MIFVSKLFEEYQLKNVTLRNRIVMAPMCMFCSDEEGKAKDWHYIHYTTRAVGGTGLIILEATGVENRGRITDRDLGLWNDGQMEGLAKIVQACQAQGAKMGIQLAHAGRKSEVLAEPSIAPSAIPFSENYRTPREITVDEIHTVAAAFREAAGRADQAGFDVIELHGAHGYLISEFLSPLTNRRTDEYGGSLENRARFLMEVLQEVKKAWPREKPIIVRVSAEDFAEGGNHAEELAKMIRYLKDQGIDMVNVSSGGVVNVAPKVYPGYQVTYAETIKRDAEVPVIAGGLISSPQMAEEILQNGRADLIFLGRELLRNPYWPLNAAREVRDTVTWPAQYERGKL